MFLVLFLLPVVTATAPTLIVIAAVVTSGIFGLYGGNAGIGKGARGSVGLVTFAASLSHIWPKIGNMFQYPAMSRVWVTENFPVLGSVKIN